MVAVTNICGSRRGKSEDDEILVVPPIVLSNAKGEAESVVTLTSEGVLTCVSLEGKKRWSKKTGATWSEFDEKAGTAPMLFAAKGRICVASASSVVMYSPEGRVVSRIALTEALMYPMVVEEDVAVLQTASSILLYRASRMTCGRGGGE